MNLQFDNTQRTQLVLNPAMHCQPIKGHQMRAVYKSLPQMTTREFCSLTRLAPKINLPLFILIKSWKGEKGARRKTAQQTVVFEPTTSRLVDRCSDHCATTKANQITWIAQALGSVRAHKKLVLPLLSQKRSYITFFARKKKKMRIFFCNRAC